MIANTQEPLERIPRPEVYAIPWFDDLSDIDPPVSTGEVIDS